MGGPFVLCMPKCTATSCLLTHSMDDRQNAALSSGLPPAIRSKEYAWARGSRLLEALAFSRVGVTVLVACTEWMRWVSGPGSNTLQKLHSSDDLLASSQGSAKTQGMPCYSPDILGKSSFYFVFPA